MNNKKFYAQMSHGSKSLNIGAVDMYTFMVLEFKNNKVYPSYLFIPDRQQNVKLPPINYKFENKILYLAKPLDVENDLGSVYNYINGNLVSKNREYDPGFIFKPSLDSYFKRNK